MLRKKAKEKFPTGEGMGYKEHGRGLVPPIENGQPLSGSPPEEGPLT
jgi:hypothetical protein